MKNLKFLNLPIDKDSPKILEQILRYNGILTRDNNGKLIGEFYLKNGKVIKIKIGK